LTGANFGPASGMHLQLSETQDEWLEKWCQEVEFIIKLTGFMQDPRQKEVIKRDTISYRKEYKRGTKTGNEIKYKVWGQNLTPIKNDSKKTGEKNRSHHVEGHIRKQPIKNIQKYEKRGYVVNNPHDSPYVDMFIEPHWRGDNELGEITTILMFGKQQSGWSRKAINWLKSIAAKEKIDIKHALNGGEYAFPLGNGKMARVDGFCQETNTVYEFYGDYYHGNPKKYSSDEYNKTVKKTHGELYENTMKREQAIKSLGFNVVCIWECDFDSR
jgi:G:T-mismatch repair DNA endonuclease (very short patch repair protein)